MPIQKKSNGSILMKGNGSLMDDCCCTPGCSGGGPAGPFSISGYFDGFFDISCQPGNPSVAPVWDGSLNKTLPCSYTASPVFGPFSLSTQGKALEELNTKAFFFGAAWRLIVEITAGAMVWDGTKPSGSSPAGVYTKTAGCAGGPISVTIL